ncbi:MAG: hypothetical protein AB1673_07440 [Actinomycetota bacterium]
MHPIERMRAVARAGRQEPSLLAREAAAALAGWEAGPAPLVTACRRLVDRQPDCGPLWWVAARVLAAADPGAEARRAATDLARDATPSRLAEALAEDTTVVVVGWPEHAGEALLDRGDVTVLVVDAGGGTFDDAGGAVAWLRRAGSDAEIVPPSGAAAAVAAAGAAGGPVLVEALAVGPDGFVATAGTAGVAAVAGRMGVPVWLVAGEGRVLPGGLWAAVGARLARRGSPWYAESEVVPLDWATVAVGPEGRAAPAELAGRPTCPPAPELEALRDELR